MENQFKLLKVQSVNKQVILGNTIVIFVIIIHSYNNPIEGDLMDECTLTDEKSCGI